MHGIGVVEGFFGPEWSWTSRHHFCENLKSYGGDFYVYAPKRDPYLRKNWSEDHPAEWQSKLQNLSSVCRESKVNFGVGLSPFEIHDHWNSQTKKLLSDKIKKIEDLNIQYLGIFFDDMKGSTDLAEKQIEIMSFVQSQTDKKLLFCPTYYSDDPILDKVFGARPERYLEKIGQGISKDIEILWTGKKVISELIEPQHLKDVAAVLKRKPFLWDNFFANDGPRQCKFLRLKPFTGRSPAALEESAGWGLNLMNQPTLSEILFCSAVKQLKSKNTPEHIWPETLSDLAGINFGRAVLQYTDIFNSTGLDKIDSDLKQQMKLSFADNQNFQSEIIDWLDHKYVVGPECLTD